MNQVMARSGQSERPAGYIRWWRYSLFGQGYADEPVEVLRYAPERGPGIVDIRYLRDGCIDHAYLLNLFVPDAAFLDKWGLASNCGAGQRQLF